MKIKIIKGHMTTVEKKLAHAILSNGAEVGMMAKSPRKMMEIISIDKSGPIWTAILKQTELTEICRYIGENGAIEYKNRTYIQEVEIYGEGVVAMPEVAVVTPAQVTAEMPAAEATGGIMRMPLIVLQNEIGFLKQIREFLNCQEATLTKRTDRPLYEGAKYFVTTPSETYEMERVDYHYQFVAVPKATTLPVAEVEVTQAQATVADAVIAKWHAPKVAMPEATNATVETAPITASARFFWNGVKIGDSKKLIKVWYSFNKAYPDRQASLMIYTKSSVGELTGLAGLQKNGSDYATDLYLGDCATITENMPEYIPALTAALESKKRHMEKVLRSDPKFNKANIQFLQIDIQNMETELNRVTTEQVENELAVLTTQDTAEVMPAAEAETTAIPATAATAAINLNEVQVGIPGKGIARCAFAPSTGEENREAVMMVLANGISGTDVIHHRLTKYKMLADPRHLNGFGVVLAESYEGLKYRIPFIVRWGDEGWNDEALADFSKVVNL